MLCTKYPIIFLCIYYLPNILFYIYRYATQTAALRGVFSEYALIKYRVIVEIEWLKAMARSSVS